MEFSESEFIKNLKHDYYFEKFEAERKSKLFMAIVTELILAIFLYGGVYFFCYLLTLESGFEFLQVGFGIVYVVALICFLGNPFWSNKDFKDQIKNKYKKIIKNYFTLTGFGKSGFLKETLQLSNLFPSFKEIEYDDCLKGCYKDVSFKVGETILTDFYEFGRNKIESTVFKGIIISFDLNKKIIAHTIVTSKNDYNALNLFNVNDIWLLVLTPLIFTTPILLSTVDWGNNPLIWFIMAGIPCFILLFIIPILRRVFYKFVSESKNMKKLDLEDPKFNKKFNIYSKDEIEGRYLVTTGFMERLLELQTAFGTKNIKCAFFDKNIMFAISSHKDFFELGSLYQPFGKDIKNFYKQIKSIYNMIDHFKLNEKTGL